ncbi:MAG: MFS transporter, partial [Deltaproteobacteria bacterium]|nr:MFS transporter [Deltaproteobacteria bacterium]
IFYLVTGVVLLAASAGAGWLWELLGPGAPFLAGALISCAALALLVLQRGVSPRRRVSPK